MRVSDEHMFRGRDLEGLSCNNRRACEEATNLFSFEAFVELHLGLHFLLLQKLVALTLTFALECELLTQLLDLLTGFQVLDVDRDLILPYLLIVLRLQLLEPGAKL
jgi:hypothetical protein